MAVRTDKRSAFLWDVFVTALEGGIGYWSAASEYHIWRSSDGEPDTAGFFATIEDGEDDGKEYRIDAAVIARGLGRIVRGEVEIASSIRGNVMLANATNGDDADLDAIDADCVVQAGLFGEVVYG